MSTETIVDKNIVSSEEIPPATNQPIVEPSVNQKPESHDSEITNDSHHLELNNYEKYLLLVVKKLFSDYFDGENEPHPIFSNFLF